MNKIIIALLCGIMSVQAFAQHDISMDGNWLFVADSVDHSAGLPAEAWEVQVPHTYNIMEGLENYAGEAWYEKHMFLSDSLRHSLLHLYFEAVYHDATVYVNGHQAGSHLGKGYTPFMVDITRWVIFGCMNSIVVRVDNRFTPDNFPYQRAFDWANDGGIIRHVRMHVSGRNSIRYTHFTPSFNPHDSIGTTHVSIRLHEPQIRQATFHILLRNKLTAELLAETTATLRCGTSSTFDMDMPCGKVIPWHFDHPQLYDFEVNVMDRAKISDTQRGHIGFRSISIEHNRMVLNGECVRLPGIESMPGSNPQYGMAEPTHYVKATAAMLKDMNATITRFHWIQGEDMLNALDSLGILMQEELSWWQQPHGRLTPQLMALAKETISEMIEAHYNHPAIYAWVVSNEVADNQENVGQLGAWIKHLDTSRMAITVGNSIYRNLTADPSLLLDMPTWNEYIGTWHGSGKKIREELPAYFDQVESALHGRPLMITENGLCEPAFTGGDRRRIDDMLYHINEWSHRESVTGYIYFCLEDYRTQMGEEGIGKYRIRRHGVTDCSHHPKASYEVLRALMSPVEIDKVQPSTAVRDNNTLAGVWQADVADRTIVVGIQVKNTIPSYILRGYQLRYKDATSAERTILLPDMMPGEYYDVKVENINSQFKFDICRPDGRPCLNY